MMAYIQDKGKVIKTRETMNLPWEHFLPCREQWILSQRCAHWRCGWCLRWCQNSNCSFFLHGSSWVLSSLSSAAYVFSTVCSGLFGKTSTGAEMWSDFGFVLFTAQFSVNWSNWSLSLIKANMKSVKCGGRNLSQWKDRNSEMIRATKGKACVNFVVFSRSLKISHCPVRKDKKSFVSAWL